ncbi:unnamed protein product, partial [Rotaria sp. Silwood1]
MAGPTGVDIQAQSATGT